MGGGGGSEEVIFQLFSFSFFLASKWSKTSRNAKKFFSNFSTPPPLSPPAPWLWTVVPPLQVGNWWIGGNILSFFNFSRGKIQIYSKYVNKSIADKKSKKCFFPTFKGGGVKYRKLEISNFFFDFFNDTFPNQPVDLWSELNRTDAIHQRSHWAGCLVPDFIIWWCWYGTSSHYKHKIAGLRIRFY